MAPQVPNPPLSMCPLTLFIVLFLSAPPLVLLFSAFSSTNQYVSSDPLHCVSLVVCCQYTTQAASRRENDSMCEECWETRVGKQRFDGVAIDAHSKPKRLLIVEVKRVSDTMAAFVMPNCSIASPKVFSEMDIVPSMTGTNLHSHSDGRLRLIPSHRSAYCFSATSTPRCQ